MEMQPNPAKGGNRMAECNDRQLILLLQNNPSQGLAEAMARYGAPVKRICAAILGPEQRREVEEAVADSFVALWQGLERYDPEQPLSPWLYGIARRTALNRRRALGRAAPFWELEEELPETGGDPADWAEEREEARLLRQAVEELPPPDREIFLLRYYLYQPVKEIARRLGMTPKAVEHKLRRGRERLRKKLIERGVSP
jgi:RNA polymerase sigma-70 factor (ECF subfamily)